MEKAEIHRLRKSNSSGHVSSLPRASSADKDSDDFEFGCVTQPERSPPGDPSRDSPADHLFFNGRLLPHAFLAQQLSSSRASSASSSRDSLTTSSRSNSANSRSSSARTSSSDGSERRLWAPPFKASFGAPIQPEMKKRARQNKPAAGASHGPSHRWQFIVAAPPLKPAVPADGSRRKRGGAEKKQGTERAAADRERSGRCRRGLRSLAAACMECHSMEPSRKTEFSVAPVTD